MFYLSFIVNSYVLRKLQSLIHLRIPLVSSYQIVEWLKLLPMSYAWRLIKVGVNVIYFRELYLYIFFFPDQAVISDRLLFEETLNQT